MLWNLLTSSSLPEGYQDVSVGEAALYALIGYLVVFAGIAFLIFIVWLVGQLIAKAQTTKQSVKTEKTVEPSVVSGEDSDEDIDDETVVLIMAALMAYYEANNPKCEFTVKRIKRVRRNDYA